MNILAKIRQMDKISTVFTINGVQALLGTQNKKTIYNAINYGTLNNQIHKIVEGIFAFDKNYSRAEFANKFRKPSYVSLYTILEKKGIVFQHYSTIYLVSRRSETVEIDGQKYVYRKIKDEILFNLYGINMENEVSVATPERAICDKLYLDGDEYFDHLTNISWKMMKSLNRRIYSNHPRITKFINKYS